MKILLTKTLFISLLFSASVSVVSQVHPINSESTPVVESVSQVHSINSESTPAVESVSGLRKKVIAVGSYISNKAGKRYSFVAEKANNVCVSLCSNASKAYTYVAYQAALAKAYLAGIAVANPKEAKIAISSLATILTAGGFYGIYTAVKNGITKNKTRFTASTISSLAGLTSFYFLAIQNGMIQNNNYVSNFLPKS
jgi:hypothetical protein